MLSSLGSDLKYAFRTLARNPGFAAVSILALALGIGANSAIFTAVNAVLLNPLRLYHPEQLVVVRERNLPHGFPQFSLSPGNYLTYRDQNHSFRGIAALSGGNANMSSPGVEPERLKGSSVTINFFDVMGQQPALGRAFTADEGKFGNHHEVILSYGLWQRRFGGRSDVLGSSLNLGGESYSVVGVMPAGFDFPGKVDIWRPLAMKDADWQQRGGYYLYGIRRLRDGVTMDRAMSILNLIAKRLQHDYPASNDGWDTLLQDLREQAVGKVRPAMLTLLAAVGFVLLIACANLANLLLSRASARRREIGIRGAIGASKGRLIRQLMTESLTLAGIGASLGLALALLATRLMSAIPPTVLPRASEIHLDWRAVLFTGAVGMLTGILFGLAPALQMARADVNSALREGGRGNSTGFRRGNLRGLLVAGEVAVAVLLLCGSVLMIRSFYRLESVDPGFDPSNVLTFRVNLPGLQYGKDEQVRAFYDRALEKVRSLPGVTAAGAAQIFPLSNSDYILTFLPQDRPPAQPGQEASVMYYAITPGCLEAMKIPLKAGRLMRASDGFPGTPVALISEALARKFYPDKNPLGQRVLMGNGVKTPAEIIGVVGDVHSYALDSTPGPTLYYSASHDTFGSMFFAVRTANAPDALIPAIRPAMRELDRELPIDAAGTVSGLVEDSLSQRHLTVLLLGVFAGLALLLAMIGIYGVLAYAVTQAAPEIGIRIALGAKSADILRMVLGYGGALMLVGVVAGTIAALLLGRVLETQLYEVKASDPATYGLVALTLAAAGLAACFVPAWRAMRVDPLQSIRAE